MADRVIIVDSEKTREGLQEILGGGFEILLLEATPLKVSFASGEKSTGREALSFEFSPAAGMEEFCASLISLKNREMFIILEPGQLGDYWSWMISEYLKAVSGGSTHVGQVRLMGLNRSEVDESLAAAGVVDEARGQNFLFRSLFHSCMIRHVVRLLGTASGPGDLPFSFTNLTTLFLINEREFEINLYSSTMKWQINVLLEGKTGGFKARLDSANNVDEGGFIETSDQVADIVNKIKGPPFIVTDVARSDILLPAPAPYQLHQLLQDAFVLYGIQPKQVLEATKELTYGIEIDGVRTGLIGYSFQKRNGIVDAWIGRIKKQVSTLFGADALVEDLGWELEGDYYYPLCPDLSAEGLGASFSENSGKVYELIRTRALASQMHDAEGDSITVTIEAGATRFKSQKRSITHEGYLVVYQRPTEKDLTALCPLVDLKKGDNVKCGKISPEQTNVFPAEDYTFESLFADLMEFGIELDGSTVVMIQNLLDKDYIAFDEKGYFHSKDRSKTVSSVINKVFPTMTGINLSAYVEQTAAEMITTRKSPEQALAQFEQTFIRQGKPFAKKAPSPQSKPIAQLRPQFTRPLTTSGKIFKAPPKTIPLKQGAPEPENLAEEVVQPTLPAEETVVPLPVESEIVEEATGPPVADESMEALEHFNQEVVAEAINEKAEAPAAESILGAVSQSTADGVMLAESDRSCQACGRPMIVKKDRFGEFLSCSGYPACRHAESLKTSDEPALECPACKKGKVIQKRTSAGKDLYVCPENGCEFMAWSRPHDVQCAACGSPFLVEKRNLRGEMLLRCPRAGCNYMEELDGGPPVFDNSDVTAPKKKKKVRVRRAKSGGGKRRVVVRRK